MKNNPGNGIPQWIERSLALAAVIFLAPVLAIIAASVKLASRGPILFRHKRIGKDGRAFYMLKFRTMRPDSSGPAVTKRGDARITGIGRLLRRTKLDELPELWNVVRGDMSLVGPRPEAAEYVALGDVRWRRVLSVRPGISDPTTVYLRNEEDLLARAAPDHEAFYRQVLLPQKLRGYEQYLSNRTWKRDVAVLWLTTLAVFVPGLAPAPAPEQVARGPK